LGLVNNMDWQKYSTQFTEAAKGKGLGEESIEACLAYAANLHRQNLPIIYDQRHVAMLTGYDLGYLRKAANSPNFFYRRYEIPKRNGKVRVIHEPLPNLKDIQRWILKNILYKKKVSRVAKAFVQKRSLRDNAYFHQNKGSVLKLDITDFFGSIKLRKVYRLFKDLGYSKAVAAMLASLCCLNKKLPQGAPTSPALSNLVSRRLDARVFGFAKKRNIRYTRYADDMTFSGNFEAGVVIKFVTRVLREERLKLNAKKTRFMLKHQQQEVTGVVTNCKLQVSRDKRRRLRQEIYYLKKYGLASHLEKLSINKSAYLHHLAGRVGFAKFINPEDKGLIESSKYIRKLLDDRKS